MEQKEIQFGYGISRAPSIQRADGELSECVNLIPKNGELVNVKPADMQTLGITLQSGEELLTIHETAEYKHYITKYDGTIWYYDNGNRYNTTLSANYVKQVVSVGNALAVIYEQDKLVPMKYLLWKNSSYIVLGDMPDVKLDFLLTGDLYSRTYPNSVAFQTSEEGESKKIYNVPVSTITTDSSYTGKYLCLYPESGTLSDGSQIINYTSKGLVAGTKYRVLNGTAYKIWITGAGGINIVLNANEDALVTLPYEGLQITNTGSYVIMSAPLANLSISFLKSETELSVNDIILKKTEENYTAMMGNVKEFINYVYKDKNQFIFPFFVRYGLKLFDGSICKLSEPILMLPNNGVAPIMITSGSGSYLTVNLIAIAADLNIKPISINIGNWSDIITGISIGISSPIYRIKEGEDYNMYVPQGKVTDTSSSNISENYGIVGGEKKTLSQLIESNNISLTGGNFYFPPSYSKKEFNENIKSSNIFYEIKEYKISDLQNITTQEKIDLSSVMIEAIETLPKMTDDYNSSNKFFPSGGFHYNNRLNIYDIKSLPYTPISPASPVLNTSDYYKCIFYISNVGKESIVDSGWIAGTIYTRWIYYGNINAKKCRICKRVGSNYQYKDIPLSMHPWLNGSYAILDDDITYTDCTQADCEPSIVSHINLMHNSNIICASNANNPFYFPVSGQSNVGTGTIKGVSTSAKAMSTGQYGQYPLYAFATDGIWAMNVDEQGRYGSPNPTVRDVVENMDSVCQIDDSLVYASSQGLKQLVGSETKLLSAIMDGTNVNEKDFLDNMDDNHNTLYKADTNSIVNMLAGCKIAYDNAGGRKLHIYPSNCESTGKHYIYDLDQDVWTTAIGQDGKVKKIVPGYPYSVMQNSNGKLQEYNNKEDNNTIRHGVILTRAMHFGNPFVTKMLCDLKLVYTKNNDNSKCKIAVFVSNDRVKWKQLTSLRKHSYQWYRFRIQTDLTDMDALTAVTCLVDDKITNKIR